MCLKLLMLLKTMKKKKAKIGCFFIRVNTGAKHIKLNFCLILEKCLDKRDIFLEPFIFHSGGTLEKLVGSSIS